jgi:DNA-binding transcriptional ArsR family regulator
MLSDLEVLFSSAARVQILRLFLLHPDRPFYQREIERETEQPIRAVQREVARLVEVGLLTRSEEGNRVYYRTDPDYPLLSQLAALFEQASGEEREAETRAHRLPPEPSSVQQPFSWMTTPAIATLPPTLRQVQVEGEWDRAY